MQAHTWLSDVNQFVSEDDNEFSYSVRLSALDLINVCVWMCELSACVDVNFICMCLSISMCVGV